MRASPECDGPRRRSRISRVTGKHGTELDGKGEQHLGSAMRSDKARRLFTKSLLLGTVTRPVHGDAQDLPVPGIAAQRAPRGSISRFHCRSDAKSAAAVGCWPSPAAAPGTAGP
jgi:hypothetical protein